MKQPLKKRIEETDEGKAIIKAYLEGKPISEIMELSEYSLLEFWLGEKEAFWWLDMLEYTDPSELERWLK